MKEFSSASMDKWTKITTAFVFLLALVFLVASLFTEQYKNTFTGGLIILILAILVAYLLIPKLVIEEGKLIIKSPLLKKIVPFNNVKEVLIPDNKIRIRTFGVGGLFGFFGYFNLDEFWMVTNRKSTIALKLNNNKSIVVSPKDKLAFLNEIEKQISRNK